MPNIVVVGSSNTDMVVKTSRIPRPGETVMGGDFVVAAGGKGANQAAAAARLGAKVYFIACTGDDVFGEERVSDLESFGVDTGYVVKTKDAPSGVALIVVDEAGENSIVVAPGSNADLKPEHVDRAKDAFSDAGVVVTQLEIPIETVARTLELAKDAGAKTILNPAPYRELPAAIFNKVDIFIPNETEAAAFTGMPVEADPIEKGRRLLEKGVGAVVLTLGAEGALVVTESGYVRVPSPKVTPVDTTAAGDAFTGGFATALAEGMDLVNAAKFASYVAAISVTRMGAQPSMPARQEVEEFIAIPQQ